MTYEIYHIEYSAVFSPSFFSHHALVSSSDEKDAEFLLKQDFIKEGYKPFKRIVIKNLKNTGLSSDEKRVVHIEKYCLSEVLTKFQNP